MYRNAILLAIIFITQGISAQSISTLPPAGNLRTAAEWEEVQTLVVTWRSYPAILAEIIRYAQEECQVIVHATNTTTAQSDLVNVYGVPLGPNVTFEQQPSNSLWIRDYGANTVYIDDVDSLFLVDWKYNRPSRVQDDSLPRAYARILDVNMVEMNIQPNYLQHTGGNFMSDGFGTAFSSKLILDENTDKSENQINTLMQDYMGIDTYIKMETLPYDGIHHIDMHMKLLDEETLLIGQYPTGTADGPQIEANLLYVLNNYNSVFGTPYKIVRVVQPPDDLNRFPNQGGDYRTYSNAIFINKTVLLPVYEERYDTTALRVWRESLPGYRVVGIDCNDIIPASGAIHCITHSVGVNDPLLISHQALPDTYNTTDPYVVTAYVNHRSGIAGANVFYTTDTTQAYTALPMVISNEAQQEWTASIPAQPGDTEVFYYIQATSESGKTQVRPIVAPEGWWKFRVLDTTSVITNAKWINEQVFRMGAFPNPSSGITCIPVNAPAEMTIELDILDLSGRTIQHVFQGKAIAGENRYFIQTKDWASGIYQIRLSSKFGQAVQKLVVQ